MPSLTVTEQYSDNYLKTADNEKDEYITSIILGFSAGFIEKQSKIYFNYNPSYIKYDEFDERDTFSHAASLSGEFQPTKFTNITGGLNYSGNNDKNSGESWSNSGRLNMKTQMAEHTTFNFSQSYTQNYDEQVQTGNYVEHNVNKTSAGINHKFGEKDTFGVSFLYSFDEYDTANSDDNKSYKPSGNLTYWFTPLNGISSAVSYENKEFDNSTDDLETYTGYIRYLRRFSRHFDGYLKYRHSYTDRTTGDHTIFHPSIGFDWQVTEDSGISLGVGVLFDEWGNSNPDSERLFFDLDAYKIFNFSRRGNFTLSANSGYSDSGEDADSLGFTIYYRAAAQLNYQLQKRLSSNLFATYKLDQFDDPTVNREDATWSAGAGLSWLPLKWLSFSMNCAYTDFDTDDAARRGYDETKITFSVSLFPEKPIRPETTPSRDSFEQEVYNR